MRSRRWCSGVLASAVILSGCSSQDVDPDEAKPPPDAGSATGSTSGSADAEPTGPADSAEPSAPTIRVADGPLRSINTGDPAVGDLVQYRLPTPQWETSEIVSGAGRFDLPNGTSYNISGTGLGVLIDTPLRRFRRGVLETVGPPAEPRVAAAPNRSVGGEPGYVVQGEGRQGFFYGFGTIYRDHIVTIEFTFPRGGKRAQEWIESVLASVEWL